MYIRLLCSLLVLVISSGTMGFAYADSNDRPIAVISDIKGDGVVKASRNKIKILDRLSEQSQLTLDAGSIVTIVYLDSAMEYVIHGPAKVSILKDKPSVKGGKLSQKKLFHDDVGLAKIPSQLESASSQMRGIAKERNIALKTLDGTIVLESRPVFRWDSAGEDVIYNITLFDGVGDVLLSEKTKETYYELPLNMKLVSGEPYTWEISAKLSNGKNLMSFSDFMLATDSDREQLAIINNIDRNDFSAKVIHTLLLEQNGYKDLATKSWKQLSKERANQDNISRFIRN